MGTPILLHPSENREILTSLGSFPVVEQFFAKLIDSPGFGAGLIQSLFGLALLSLIYLYFKKDRAISGARFLRELITLFALQWVFRQTSVLISFGAYFVIWHSLSSLVDQIHSLDSSLDSSRKESFRARAMAYVRYALPNWLISAGLVSLLVLTEFSDGFGWSKLTLIFGAAILLTPPHLLVIHSLHSRKSRPATIPASA